MNIRWGHIFLGACGAALASTAVFTAPEPARPAAPFATRPARVMVAAFPGQGAPVVPDAAPAAPSRAFLESYCITCHNAQAMTAGLALDTFDVADVTAHTAEWEKVVVKLRAGLMPPGGMPRPPQDDIDAFATSVEDALDDAAVVNPNPGRTEPFHRLNRAEYRNAVRDLLDLDLDVSTMLPTDEVSYGFDNIAGVLKLSPLLTDRYLVTAQKVARLAVGTPAPPNGDFFRVPDQLDQDIRLEGMSASSRTTSSTCRATATPTSRSARWRPSPWAS
jgi:hypothetical protein